MSAILVVLALVALAVGITAGGWLGVLIIWLVSIPLGVAALVEL